MVILCPFLDDPSNLPPKETKRMKPDELYYRKPRSESFQPRYRTNQPKAVGSINEDTQQRIVMLYTCGQSIESITKEVGWARHLVVHVLQSKGVFGNRRTEPDGEESRTESPAVEELKEELVNEERKPGTLFVQGSEPESAVEVPPGKAKVLRKSKSPVKLRSMPAAKTRPKPSGAEKTTVTNRWSPVVLDALCKVVGQHDLNPDMTLEEVKKMAFRHKR
jgi:hypothetical protein